MSKRDYMQKMYHIGQSYTSSAFAKINFNRRKLAPEGSNQACFALVSPNRYPRTEV